MRGAKTLDQPARHTHVIGVVMGDKHPPNRLAPQDIAQDIFPNRHAFAGFHASIDDAPVIALVQRIDIHMIQRHGQRQPNPQHALGHFDGLACLGRGVPGGAHAPLAAIHHAASSSFVMS